MAGLPVVDEATDGDVMVGIVGTTGARAPTVGDTVIIGTAAAELTPRLLISVDPIGIPVRAAAPATVGAVDIGVDDEATLLEPEPHIPDNPDVSIIPGLVDIPDVADPDVAGVPDIVEDVEAPTGVPPPSKVEVDPNICDGAVPTVEHDVPLLGTVPVVEVGIGLTPGDASSVAPNGIPVPPTDAPGLLPSGEVIPSEGVVATAPTWAIAGLQHTKSQATATVKKDFMEGSSEMSRANHVRS
jgi:hypothetical protein